jgi:RNA polymerase sigma factor (TIGR02999 family)
MRDTLDLRDWGPAGRLAAADGLSSTTVRANVAAAPADLLPLVYQSLKDLARQRMAMERVGHTLQATALVHEAYLRLAGARGVRWAGQVQFYHAAAEAMRRILIEHARSRGRIKRGGKTRRVPINLLDLAEEGDRDEILALDEAIRRLEEHTPDIAAVVRLRFYAGLTVSETADALAMGRRSVDRAWAYARVWLYRELYGEDAPAQFPA